MGINIKKNITKSLKKPINIKKNILNINKNISNKFLFKKQNLNLNNILIPISPKKIDIDYNKLTNYIKRYIEPRKEYYNDTNTKNLELESGFSEWWISKTSNGTKIANGNTPMDVITKKKIAIDTMCLCLNNNFTNEKSIMQNFNSSGNNLDLYFHNKNDKDAITMFVNDYKLKLTNFCNEYNISNKNLYYCIFISTNTNIYISFFKINIFNTKYITSMGFTKSLKSININNFIDINYGNVKLYKSKKRLELRINKNILNSFNTMKIY
jgi:hypothetical protein